MKPLAYFVRPRTVTDFHATFAGIETESFNTEGWEHGRAYRHYLRLLSSGGTGGAAEERGPSVTQGGTQP